MTTPRQQEAQLRALMGGRRFVVCDCETSGVTADARILSIAFVELWHDINGESRVWYVNPGRFTMAPKAAEKNRITAEHLRGRPSFAQVHADLEPWLTAGAGVEHVLVGHSADFDARRLAYEYELLGLVLPPLTLLDTGHLAQAAGIVCGPSLHELLTSVGLTNPAAHTSQGDALITAQAARLLLARLAGQLQIEQLHTALDKLLVPFDPSSHPKRRDGRDDSAGDEPELIGDHLRAHSADLRDGRRRRHALDTCLAERCAQLATRMEDGIVSTASAQQVVEWSLGHLLGAGELDRQMTGRVLAGLGRALRRCEKPSYAERVLFDDLGPLLLSWGPCTAAEQCGRCRHQAGTCRFSEAGRQAVEAFIYASSEAHAEVCKAAAEAYLPGFDPAQTRSAGRPPEGLYQRLRRLGLLDAAGYGATRIAQFRRDQGKRDWGYAVARKAWDDGCRTPHLADLLASMTVLDGIGLNRRGADPKAHLRAALDIIDTCLADHAGQAGSTLRRLERRRERVLSQLATTPRHQAQMPRNVRAPRSTRPGTAPLVGHTSHP
ncbi:MAG TPA: 3'-5' exonuclease [Dermatophilaceae bacterium]